MVQYQVNAGQADLVVEVTDGLVKLLFTGDLPGNIELTANLARLFI